MSEWNSDDSAAFYLAEVLNWSAVKQVCLFCNDIAYLKGHSFLCFTTFSGTEWGPCKECDVLCDGRLDHRGFARPVYFVDRLRFQTVYVD